jgi:hypothetical protein
VLSAFAVYHYYKIMGQSSTSIVSKGAPHFYSPLTVNDKTIESRFSVQLWECLPFFAFGTSYFAILFGDRVISWLYNPISTIIGEITLPISFNSAYHAGADMALIVMLPAILVQYVMAAPIYILVHNRSISLKVSEKHKIDQFLRHSYVRIIVASVVTASIVAIGLNLLGTQIMTMLGGTELSTRILMYSSAGAVLLSAFGANSLFMIFLGKLKELAVVSALSAIVVLAGGVFAATYGFENIVLAYLGGTAIAALSSTIVVARTMMDASSSLFSRYV